MGKYLHCYLSIIAIAVAPGAWGQARTSSQTSVTSDLNQIISKSLRRVDSWEQGMNRAKRGKGMNDPFVRSLFQHTQNVLSATKEKLNKAKTTVEKRNTLVPLMSSDLGEMIGLVREMAEKGYTCDSIDGGIRITPKESRRKPLERYHRCANDPSHPQSKREFYCDRNGKVQSRLRSCNTGQVCANARPAVCLAASESALEGSVVPGEGTTPVGTVVTTGSSPGGFGPGPSATAVENNPGSTAPGVGCADNPACATSSWTPPEPRERIQTGVCNIDWGDNEEPESSDVQFADLFSGESPITTEIPADMRRMVIGMKLAQAFIRENSRYIADLFVDYYAEGSLVNPLPYTDILESIWDLAGEWAVNFCDPDIDYRKISYLVIPSPNGASRLEEESFDTDDGEVDLKILFVPTNGAVEIAGGFLERYFESKEVGGRLYNSVAIDCEEESFVENCIGSVWDTYWGNLFDASSPGADYLGGHLMAYQKSMLGWIQSDMAFKAGRTVKTIRATESPLGDIPQLLYLPYKKVCIEYRKPMGLFDKDFSRLNFEGEEIIRYNTSVDRLTTEYMQFPPEGCLLISACGHVGDIAAFALTEEPVWNMLLDATPNSSVNSVRDFADACLREGETFNSEGVVVRWEQSGSEVQSKAKVTVFLGFDTYDEEWDVGLNDVFSF